MLLGRQLLGEDDVWQGKIISISGIMFLVLLGDAILSFWVPNFLYTVLGSSWAMGLVMGFSSIVGVGADLILPQIVRKISVEKLIWGAICTAIIFIGLLRFSLSWPIIGILLVAMGIWGLYYEFLGFASQQFVADATPLHLHSTAWALLTWFRNLAYFLGPLTGGWLIMRNGSAPLGIALILVLFGAGLLFFIKRRHRAQTSELELKMSNVDLVHEIEHWAVLFVHVWPVVILSLFLGLIDAAFWTIGVVLTERLAHETFWGGWWLSAYVLPSLFTGFALAKLKIVHHKKMLAEILLLTGCLALAGLWWNSGGWQLVLVAVGGTMFWLANPLTDAVYSDIVARMGRQRRHLMGLSRSSMSLAYVIGPILAGWLAVEWGERQAFAICGFLGILLALGLLITTPKKLKLPQQGIQKWEN